MGVGSSEQEEDEGEGEYGWSTSYACKKMKNETC
jgi:hypothetical protein